MVAAPLILSVVGAPIAEAETKHESQGLFRPIAPVVLMVMSISSMSRCIPRLPWICRESLQGSVRAACTPGYYCWPMLLRCLHRALHIAL